MDTLSEVLKTVRVVGAMFISAELAAPWGFRSPPIEALAPCLGIAGTDRLVIYHFLLEGSAEVTIDSSSHLSLSPGELVIFPHGHQHVMFSGRPFRLQDISQALPEVLANGIGVLRLGGSGPMTKFACGYFACDQYASRLFLSELPSMLKIEMRQGERGAWLEKSIAYALAETGQHRSGTSAILAKLSEVLFVDALCRYMDRMPDDAVGWLAASRDRVVGVALAAIHGKPAHAWSIEELAREVGASRTVLTERFARFLGVSPMAYISRWRLQLGARLLQTEGRTVIQVAGDVGYESEAAFNRAFKREFGVPPARYRRAYGQRLDSKKQHTRSEA